MDRISDRVHASLRADILAGTLAPGDAVPSERRLAEDLGVNRHAVREALKRLEQAGLVTISQGGATRVRDWRDTGGLEILLDLQAGTEPPADLARSVLELRASVGVDAARRCAPSGRTRRPCARVAELAERAAAAIGRRRAGGRRRLRRAVARGRAGLGQPGLPAGAELADGGAGRLPGGRGAWSARRSRRRSAPWAARSRPATPAKAERAARALLEPDIDAFG